MAGQNVEIRLGFTADVSQAKQQMGQLQSELQRLSQLELKTPDGISKGLSKANNEVLKLSVLLKDCFNVETGKLDINRFLVQTKQYGITWDQVRTTLKSFGADGEQAMAQLNAQIAQGQTGIVQMSNLVKNLGDQFIRTAKIQISYTMLNAFTSTIRNAYNYAQDLNKSLTNIQIVTGKNTNEMRQFAVEANKAAKELSASTTAYTDAALIYYQQGLDGNAVKERTDTTIKLANVTGQSAEEVSSYMTAIWNNFADGTNDLEYYADAITALGASTASSSEEIARGLSQFAAIADTVGLSYEYATASLATVVAQTRLSADTVGNSFKTIFSRLESLNLGETLDDNTTLTKYTQALEKVGVYVKDGNGGLREMDEILYDLGEKWSYLNDEQKNGLAYTVAGARQYTNFIALMDNWDKVLENVNIADQSEGTLQEQADIYAESWEAANKRLKASWQELYTLIIKDDFFIGVTKGIATTVEGVSNLIKSLGGLKGLLPLIIGLVSQLFSSQITQGITSVAGTIQSIGIAAKGEDVKLKNQATQYLSWQSSKTDMSPDGSYTANIDEQNRQLQEQNEKFRQLNITQQQYNDLLQRRNFLLKENADKANNEYADELENIQQLEKEQNLLENISTKLAQNAELAGSKKMTGADIKNSNLSQEIKDRYYPEMVFNKELTPEQMKEVTQALTELDKSLIEDSNKITADMNDRIELMRIIKKEALETAKAQEEEAQNKYDQARQKLEELRKTNQDTDTPDTEYYNKVLAEKVATQEVLKEAHEKVKQLEEEAIQRNQKYGESVKQTKAGAEDFVKDIEKNAQTVQALSRGFASLYSLGTTTNHLFKELSSGSITWGGALSSLVSLLGTTAFALSSVTKALETTKIGLKLLEAEIYGFPVVGWILAIVAAVGALMGILTGLHEARVQNIKDTQEEINNQNDLIDSTQELSQSIEDLIDNYKELRNAGEASLSTFKEIEQQLPDLIQYYKELGLNTEQLEAAFEKSKITGNISGVQYAKAQLDSQVAYLNYDNAVQNYQNGGLNMAQVGTGTYRSWGNSYKKFFNTEFEEAENNRVVAAFQNNNLGNGNIVIDNLNDASEMIQYYENLQKAKQELMSTIQNDSWTDTEKAAYQEINKELNALKDNYAIAKAGSNEVISSISASINQGEFDSVNQILNGYTGKISEYEEIQDNLISALKEETGKNEQEIEEALRSVNGVGEAIKAKEYFQNVAQEAAFEAGKENWQKYYEDLNTWYDSLESAADQRLAHLIEYTAGMTANEMNEQLAELKEQQIATQIKNEAIGEDGLDEAEFEKYSHYLKEIADASDILSDELMENDAAVNAVTKDIMLMNQGIEALNKGYENWIDILKNSDKSSQEYCDALLDIKSGLADVYDIGTEWIDSDFITAHLDEIEKIAQGDADAIESLRAALTDEIIVKIGAQLDSDKAKIFYDQINGLLDQIDPNMEIGATLNDASFIAALNEMIEKTGMTADQVKALFDSMGFEATFAENDVQTSTKVPIYTTYETIQEGQKVTIGGTEYTGAIKTSKTEITGYDDVVSTYPQVGLSMDGSTPQLPPVVTSLTKTSNGAMNNFSKANAGGPSGSKGKSGGGGGGSTPKQKDPKQANEEIDRYHVIKNQLEDINHQLDQISKAKDRAFGADKLKYLNNEINKYENLIAAQKEYVREIEAYYASDRAIMAGYGATFDENGTINNYEDLMMSQINKYNGALTDEAEEEYNKFKDALDKYEETQDLLKEQTAQLQDYYNKVYDLKLEGIKYKVEFTIEIDDHQLKYLEFLLDQLDDAAYDTAESFAVLGRQMDIHQQNYDAYKRQILEILDLASNGQGAVYLDRILKGDNLDAIAKELNLTDEAQKALFESVDGLIDETTKLKETWEEYLDGMQKFWDAWDEKFQDQIDKIEHLSKVTDNYKKLIDVLGKDQLGVSDMTLQRLDHTLTDAAKTEYETQLANLKAAQDLLQSYRDAGFDQDPEYDELIKSLEKDIDDLEEAAQEAAIKVAETAQEELENATQRVIENWEDAVAGIQRSLESLNNAMDRAQKVKEQYMETYEQAYQITKLAREIGNSINDAAVIKNKQELADLLDHINEAQEAGVKMSEYEYEAYRKEYELLLAKAALEDAREAKSQVRMTRDSEGNMSYVYTADQGKVDKADEDYNNAAYEFAKLNDEEINEAQQQLIDLQNWLKEQWEKFNEMTQEEQDEVLAYYKESMDYWGEQMGIAFDWNVSLTEQTGLIQWELADNFNDTVLSQVTGFETLEEYMQAHVDASIITKNELYAAWDEYINDTENLVENGEIYINEQLDLIDEGMRNTSKEVKQLESDFNNEMNEMVRDAEVFRNNYEQKVQNAIMQTTALGNAISALGQTFINQMNNVNAAAGAFQNYARSVMQAAQALATLAAVEGATGGGNGGGGGSSNNGQQQHGSYYELYGVRYDTYDEAMKQANTYAAGVMGVGGMSYGQVLKDIKTIKFATGGYTGEWGSEGKLAMLHEKELVLNASDTANMFKIIDAVRDVTDALSLQAHGANVDLNSTMGASVGGMMSIDQNVNITAEFPNATDRYEIEAAFGDIINRASQFVNRKV